MLIHRPNSTIRIVCSCREENKYPIAITQEEITLKEWSSSLCHHGRFLRFGPDITIPTQPALTDRVSYLVADEEQVKLFLKEKME